uniref:Uncharacterized protein n=1 Tax=Saimiri boliviensis boliviensis TaxID=39432 RepID=A0A2K6UVK0_SAIBB
MLVNGENFGVSLNIFPSINMSSDTLRRVPAQSLIKDHTAGLRLTALSPEYQGPAEGDDHASSLQRGASPPPATTLLGLGFKCHFPCFRNPGILIM